MNSEKVKYFLSILDSVIEEIMNIFSVFSFGKKRVSFEFSPFEMSLPFEGLLSLLGRCLSFERLLSFMLLSF